MNHKLFNIIDKHTDFCSRAFVDGYCTISAEMFQDLFDYYYEEMPYGVKKARDEDPYQWIEEQLTQDLLACTRFLP